MKGPVPTVNFVQQELQTRMESVWEMKKAEREEKRAAHDSFESGTTVSSRDLELQQLFETYGAKFDPANAKKKLEQWI